MNRPNAFSCVAILLVCFPVHSTPAQVPSPQFNSSEPDHIYTVGKEVSAPELLPREFANVASGPCQSTESGKVQLSLVVDQTGKPRSIFFVRPLGIALDKLAIAVASADLFNPGKRNGIAVPVAMLLEIKLEGCLAQETDQSGNSALRIRLRSTPTQQLLPNKNAPPNKGPHEIVHEHLDNGPYRVGGIITAPVPIVTPEAKFPANNSATGVCVISLIVDANGMPQSLRVVRTLNPARDESALEAVNKYRFKPGTKDGQPVSVKMSVEVNFRR